MNLKQILDQPPRLSFVIHVHIVSTDLESLIDVLLDAENANDCEMLRKNSATSSTTQSNTAIWSILSTASARLTWSSTDFTYAHGCTVNHQGISAHLGISSRYSLFGGWLLKTLFDTFQSLMVCHVLTDFAFLSVSPFMSFKRLSKSSSAFPPPLELGKKNSVIHPDPHSTLQPRSSELHEGVTKVLYIFSKLLLAICL